MAIFSQRSTRELSPNRLALALSAARDRREPLLDLTLSNPTVAGIPYAAAVTEALARAASVPGYEPEPFGLLSARRAVSAVLGERGAQVAPERIALTASTSEAYTFVFKLLCDPGDEVLVPAPSYPLLEHLGGLESVKLVPYELGFDGAWFIDTHAVLRAVTARTRAIVLVSPNNPTGSYLKRDELARLLALGLPLVSDEVFAEYPFADDPRRACSVLAAEAGLVIALDGLSKLAALPHLKLAWMALGGTAALVGEALGRLEIILDAFLSPSTLVQRALPELLASRHTAAGAIRRRLGANQEKLVALTAGSALTPLHAEGGWYAVVRLPATASDEEHALRALAAGVVVQPGYFFDFGAAPHLVVSLLTPEATFSEGILRLVSLVA